MANETIERAIKKGTGELGAETYDEVMYEGYGPHGVAVLCEILTENRNRTAGEIRKVFEVHGGNLGTTGCVGYMFERKGVFVISTKHATEERVFEIALEAGASDVKTTGDAIEVICEVDAFQAVTAALEAAEIPTESAELTRISGTTVELDADAARSVLKLMDALEDHDDVQNCYANFNIPEPVMAELAAEG
jgi:YebC/PmpR family DNA-binding regulatory protein